MKTLKIISLIIFGFFITTILSTEISRGVSLHLATGLYLFGSCWIMIGALIKEELMAMPKSLE